MSDYDFDGYGEGIGWLDAETQAALSLDAETDDVTEKPAKADRAKVRRLVVLRGSRAVEVSGRPAMETR